MSSSAQQVMETFTAQWYNALTTALGLDPQHFQLIQTNAPLGTTSAQLWTYFDAIPPATITHYYNPSQVNSFAQDYGAVLMNLKPQNASTWLQIMGDYYPQWAAYLKTSPLFPATGGILQLFSNWAWQNISNPSTAQAAITAFTQVMNGLIPTAVSMYAAANGTFAYNGTYEYLRQQVPSAPGAQLTMDSSTTSSDVSHTWASGAVSGVGDFFWGGGSASYDALTVALGSARLVVNATFKHVMSFSAGPLSQPSTDPVLSGYKPWYNSAALALAYGTRDNTVWNNTAPTWDTTFGPNGNMPRMTTGMVVVDGIDITISSAASFSSSDQQSFQAAASGGFWPFFSANAASGWSSSVQFSDSGQLQARISSPVGNPQVLGVLVTDMAAALGISPAIHFTAIAENARV